MAGLITGETLKAGVYEWDRDISFTDAFYIDGTEDDIFIFKTTGNIIVGSGASVGLRGGAKASNIFWRVAGFVEAGTTSHLEGILLVKNHAAFKDEPAPRSTAASSCRRRRPSRSIRQPSQRRSMRARLSEPRPRARACLDHGAHSSIVLICMLALNLMSTVAMGSFSRVNPSTSEPATHEHTRTES